MTPLMLILNAHGIEWELRGDEVWAVDHYTLDGQSHFDWVNVSIVNIREWLGY